MLSVTELVAGRGVRKKTEYLKIRPRRAIRRRRPIRYNNKKVLIRVLRYILYIL